MSNRTGTLSRTRIHHAGLTSLVEQLHTRLAGDCDFSSAGVALYTSDASNYRQVPLGVVYPKSSDDIVTVTRLCREQELPVLMRGAGTSQNGQCVNEAVILDCSRYLHRVLDIDVGKRSALVEPGIVCDSLKAAAEKHGLTFGPDPATHSRCTLGGMIGNNSCGPRSMLAGKTVENVIELEVLTSDGARFWTGPTSDDELARIIERNDRQGHLYAELLAIRDEYADLIREKYPDIKRRVSGYNLDQLLPENGFNVARALVGSEGTCVSILQARLHLIKNPAEKQLIVLGFEDIYIAGDAVVEILPHSPIAMEGLDWGIVGGLVDRRLRLDDIALLPEGRAWLLVELSAESHAEITVNVDRFIEAMTASKRVLSIKPINDAHTAQCIWNIREQGASATSMSLDPEGIDPVVGWEDTAVDPLQLGDYLRAFQALIERYGYTTSLYGHFGDGCIHARITFDTRSDEGVAQWRRFSEDIARLVVQFGGSLSGEHGDGQAKAEFLPILFGDELMKAFKRFKQAWDPDSRMNPGKLIDAYRMDENLRFGPAYETPRVESPLAFIEDAAGFGRSTERCIGMGKCRSHQGAMCPSFQATGEERYSTRGRAHLLHELVRGEVLVDGWQSTEIVDSLEHCLSCKACKSECPTQVDIAAYKAVFMQKHHRTIRRPLHHHAFGRIGTFLPCLSRFATIVNPLQGSWLGKQIASKLLGISPEKSLTPLASTSFQVWASTHCHTQDSHFYWFGEKEGIPTVLWNDSVNNAYRPHVLISAVNVLKRCGHRVGVAKQHFCCGRPLYEYGFLDEARQRISQLLGTLSQHWPQGARIVVMEPSCLSVFKDEVLRLYPDDPRAADLVKRIGTLTDVLDAKAIRIVKTFDVGILHLHCHGKSLKLSGNERLWMQQCFQQIKEVESGCCGMAGVYGMRAKTRAIAITLFSRALKPAIDDADAETIVVTDGFSCFSQVVDHTGRKALHPVEVLEACLGDA